MLGVIFKDMAFALIAGTSFGFKFREYQKYDSFDFAKPDEKIEFTANSQKERKELCFLP